MAEEQPQDFSKLSLEERCQHKNWKARVSAYEELTKIFARIDDDKEWGKYGGWVRKFPADSNAAAQEKALEVTLMYLENAGQSQAGRIVAEVVAGVINKCITASKAKSKELAWDIVLMCVEIEKFEVVQEELMKGMEHKNPKVVAGCINMLTETLRVFGVKVINMKTILKKIPVLIEDRDKTVREETKKLMVELYRWLGPAFKPQLTAVKPLVVQEVEAEVEKCTDKPQQTRFLRSQQKKEANVAGEAEEDGVDDAATEEELSPDIDPYDLLDPVDILSKLPKDFYEKCEAKKWQERKEAMEALEKLLENPKLEAGDYSDLVRMLKKLVGKDSNVIVVALAGKCIAGLANGLKKKFSPYSSSCISTILEKFKEKKANVVAAMRDAIDACFFSTSLEAIQEDILLALQGKNPAVKLETNAFLARAFAKTSLKIMSDKKLMKPYFTAILANLNESDASVREAAAEAFGVAMKHLGEKALSSLTADLEPIKLQKVKEFCDKAVIIAPKEKVPKEPKPTEKSGAVKTAGSTTSKPVKRPVAKVEQPSSEDSKSKVSVAVKATGSQIRPPSKTGVAASKSNVAAGAAAKKSKTANIVAEAPSSKNINTGPYLPVNNLKCQRISDEMKLRILKWNFTTLRDEFIVLLKDLMAAAGFGQWMIDALFHDNFQCHLKAVDALLEEFGSSTEGTKCNLDLILKWATIRFFDTNPAVLIKILDYLSTVFQVLGENESEDYSMSDVEANAFIPYIVRKLGDSKENVRASVHQILRLLGKVYSPQRIFSFVMQGLDSKNARQRSDCLDELAHMIGVYGMGVLYPTPQAALKEIAKHISDRDTNVRNAALNGVVQAYYLQGEKVYKMIGQLTAKDQSLLEERIKRVGRTKPATEMSSIPIKPSSSSTIVPGSTRIPSAASVSSAAAAAAAPPPPPAAADYSPPTRSQIEGKEQGPVAITGRVLQPSNLNMTISSSPTSDEPNGHHINGLDATTTRTTILPAKYHIDFEAIDKLFMEIYPVPPLALSDTDVGWLEGEEEIALPKQRSNLRGPLLHPSSGKLNESSRPALIQQSSLSIDSIVSQLGGSNLGHAIEACVNLEEMLGRSEISSIMALRVDSMLSMLAAQMRRRLPTLITPDETLLGELNQFFRSAVALLSVIFNSEQLPKKANKDALKDITHELLVLIIDENLDNLSDAIDIIRLVNVMVVRIIENAEPNAVSCALIRLLNETLDIQNGGNPRLLELVMKCQWKLLKQHNVWVMNKGYEWDVAGILAEYNSFMKSHPFSWFNNRDGTPLKTIKTIMHALVMHAGCKAVEQELNLLPELRESEAGLYINKIIQRELIKKRSVVLPHP